jgi:C-terminal processing protease CtpA/Prc
MRNARPMQLSYAGKVLLFLLLISSVVMSGLKPAYSQDARFNRSYGNGMLKGIKSDIKKYYFDPSFGGHDLEAQFKKAENKIAQAESLSQILAIIAQCLIEFDDSHTYFLAPSRPLTVKYGWKIEMVGDKCLVVAVKPGSDADKQGIKPGDEVLKLDGFRPTRDILWKMMYSYYQINPRSQTQFLLKTPDGQSRQVSVKADIKTEKRVIDLTNESDYWSEYRKAENEAQLQRHRWVELGEAKDLLIWKLPEFDLENEQISTVMKKARDKKALILDLRDNPGGTVDCLLELAGYFFDSETIAFNLTKRDGKEAVKIKPHGDRIFKGKTVILINSKSASAAELLAKMLQLTQKAIVIGDRSSGGVMQSRVYIHELGTESKVIPYGASITNADIIMNDGKSIERVGVIPDELLLPTPQNLADNHDPVLARAAQLVGFQISDATAGKYFPIEWEK